LRVLEDKSTLLQIQHSDKGNLHASTGTLISFLAIQPEHDMENAARNLFRVAAQPGVQVIRNIFKALPKKSPGYMRNETAYSGLSLLVRIKYQFQIRSDRTLPAILRYIRKEFLKRRSMTHTILLGMGFEINLVEGERIIDLHIRGRKVKEGITVFPSNTGTDSKLIEGFLKLDRVPARFFQDFNAPDLPVVHRIGSRVDDQSKIVGFPHITKGNILLCGTDNLEVLDLLQTLTHSFTNSNTDGIFIIDTHNEFNGLINYYQDNPASLNGKNLQLFQLGRNMFINLCDVVIPLSNDGEKLHTDTIAAWKAYIISQLLLGSLTTSIYLTSRFAIPLETQIQKAAGLNTESFTIKDIKFSLSGITEEDSSEKPSDQETQVDGIFADMMAVEQITGILDHFKAFPEVNYSAFRGHFSNTLARPGTVNVFQFGSQSPLVKRASVAFLLQFLSNTVQNQVVVFPYSDEFLGQKTPYGRAQEAVPASLIDSCNTLARNNVLILGSQSLRNLASKLDSFDEIKNQVYLRLASPEDRDLIITQHQLSTGRNRWDSQQNFGVVEGEGLLFRNDIPPNAAYHFRLGKGHEIPVDLTPINTITVKRRVSTTLGLTPKKFHLLMKILKRIYHEPIRRDEAVKLIEENTKGELVLTQFASLDLYREKTEEGVSKWIMTTKGRDFYIKQLDFLTRLPTATLGHEIDDVTSTLKNLEEFTNPASDSDDTKRETSDKVKTILGSLLNLLYHVSPSPPWIRVAEYNEIASITGLEFPDFRILFNSAASLVNNLLLDYREIKNTLPEEVLKQKLISSALVSTRTGTSLDDFLPTDTLLSLKTLSRKLELGQYPENGIISVYFEMNRQIGEDLMEELNRSLGNKNGN
jgi:hypothetical protein